MKKYLFLVIFAAASCAAQVGPVLITTTSTQCAQISTDGQATVAVNVLGTWTGTLQPQATIQGQTPFNVQVTPSTSTTPQPTITANGAFVSAVAGYSTFQLCGPTSTGTATIYVRATQAQINSAGGGGGGGIPYPSGSGFAVVSSGTSWGTTLTDPLTVAHGGTGTASTLSGILRGGSPLTASEISGDCASSGSNAVTCTKTNGTVFGTFATQNYATPPAIGGTTPAAGTFSTLTIPSGGTLNWNGDTGLSRVSANVTALGNGTAADPSGTLNLANLNASNQMNLGGGSAACGTNQACMAVVESSTGTTTPAANNDYIRFDLSAHKMYVSLNGGAEFQSLMNYPASAVPAVTMVGSLTTLASAAGGAGFNLPHGAAPTSPINGDMWTTTGGVFARVNGSTVGPFGAGGGAPGGSNTQLQYNNSSAFGGITNLTTNGTNPFLSAIVAPANPSVGFLVLYEDSTDLRFHDKNASGTIGTTVVADAGAANNFLTAISAAGVVSKARPTCANLSDSAGGCSMSTTAGGDLSGTFPSPTVVDVNGVAYGASPATNTVPVVTAANTVTYEAVPNAALANSSTTVNGQTCVLGSSCTISAANASLSNLSAVGVNALLNPNTDNTLSLNDANHRWIDYISSGVFAWTNGAGTKDTGLSRESAGVVDVGNGTAGNVSGTLKAGNLNAAASISTGTTPAVCGAASGCFGATEGATGATPTALQSSIRIDSTSHKWQISLNNTAEFISLMNWPATEAAAGNVLTLAGIETAALTAPFVIQDTNSTNSNTSTGLIVSHAGTSIGGIGLIANTVSGTAAGNGDIIRGYQGATVTNGALTGGTIQLRVLANGMTLSGASAPNPTIGSSGGEVATEGTAFTGTSTNYGWYNDSTLHCFDIIDQTTNIGCAIGEASIIAANVIPKALGTTPRVGASDLLENANLLSNAVTNTAWSIQGGLDATTTGASGTLTLRGEDVTGGSTASIAGGAITLRGGDTASTGNSNSGGAVTIRGGNATGGTGTSDAGGAVSATGGNCTATTGTCTPGTYTATSGGFTAAFTNGAGADATIAAGLGTGNAAVSHVKIKSPALGLASGSTAQAQITRWVSHTKAGSTTSATATNMFNIASATNTAWGVDIVVHVDLISSTPNVCGTTQRFSLTGTNNNGTFGTVNVVSSTASTLCSTGTLTLAVTATAANPSVIAVVPTWATITAITSDTITIEIENVSQQEIALL